MLLLIIGCSILGIYIPPQWNYSEVRTVSNNKMCVTGSAKVRGNVKFAEDTSEHRAKVKLLSVYTELVLPFSKYIDEQTGMSLALIKTTKEHGVDKGPLRAELANIYHAPNKFQAKRVWAMYCFQSDEAIFTRQFANSWLKVYKSQEKKQDDYKGTDESEDDTVHHNDLLSAENEVKISENVNKEIIEKTIEDEVLKIVQEYLQK
jgi:hypothetical protein